MKPTIPAPLLLLAPLTLILTACGNPATPWLGTYTGEQQDLVEGNTPEANSFRKVELQLNPDNTFVLTKVGFPLSGVANYSKDKVVLKVKKVLDQPFERAYPNAENKPITFTKNEEGQYVLIDPADFGRDPIILTPKSTD